MGISLFIILFDLAVVKSVPFKENDPLLVIGISLDFVVIIPLLLYFLVYRKLDKKMISILPFALLGYIAVMLLIPPAGQGPLEIVKYILIPLELLFLGYEIYKIYQIVLHYRNRMTRDSHPIETLRTSLEANFRHAKLTSLLVHDASVFYYALFAWRKKPYVRPDSASFSYHINSSWLITVLILSKMLIIEGALLHILLMQWSHIAAWLLSLGNIYVILLLVADYRAMRLNPILVSDHQIKMQYGIQMFSFIDKEHIESISVVNNVQLTKNDLKTSFTPIAIEPNVVIQLKNKMSVTRLFGKRQMVDRIYLFIDKPHEFQAECQK